MSDPRLLAGEVGYALRELWRSRIAFIFTFLFPLTWLVLLGLLIGNAPVAEGSEVRLMQLVTPTAAVMGVLFGTYPTVAIALADARERGVLKRVRGTPLPPRVFLGGRIGAALVMALGALVSMLVVGMVGYGVDIVWRTAAATLVTTVVAVASLAALGLAVATVSRSSSMATATSIGTAVAVAFLSGVMAWGNMPVWADRIAAVFPLKPFNDAVQHQFDPSRPGAGWDLGALVVITVWGLGAAAVATRSFRWDPAARHRGAGPVPHGAARTPARTPAGIDLRGTAPGRPKPAALLAGEVRWTALGALRDAGWVFFAIAMPVGLYAFMESLMSDGDLAAAGGATFHVEMAAGMIGWGALVTAFVNLPEAVAVARDRGLLKRLRGTPLSPSTYLGGRTAAAVVIAVLTAALVLAVGLAWFGLELSWAGLPLAVAVLALGTTTLAACGFVLASVMRSSKAVTAVGLAISLPLAFFSDVFVIGQTPDWMGRVGSFLPLKPLTDAVAAALDPAGPAVSWASVGVLLGWLVAAGALALRLFRWTPRAA